MDNNFALKTTSSRSILDNRSMHTYVRSSLPPTLLMCMCVNCFSLFLNVHLNKLTHSKIYLLFPGLLFYNWTLAARSLSLFIARTDGQTDRRSLSSSLRRNPLRGRSLWAPTEPESETTQKSSCCLQEERGFFCSPDPLLLLLLLLLKRENASTCVACSPPSLQLYQTSSIVASSSFQASVSRPRLPRALWCLCTQCNDCSKKVATVDWSRQLVCEIP